MEWQPIDTALKVEGQDILVWDGEYFYVASFIYHDERGCSVWWNGDITLNPTHWMPLPEPPK